jgi:hypothetical protein
LAGLQKEVQLKGGNPKEKGLIELVEMEVIRS